MSSDEEVDKLKLFWDHFFKAETGTYEKSSWLDLFLAEFLIRVQDGAAPRDLINFCPISGVVSLVGCELLCGIHRVTSAINTQYVPPAPAPAPALADAGGETTAAADDGKQEEPTQPKSAGLFSMAHAQSSAQILQQYLLAGVAWRCLLLLKLLGVEGVSCCRQLSSVLIWVCGELGAGRAAPPNPHLPPRAAPAPAPAHPHITALFSNRIWSKQKQSNNALGKLQAVSDKTSYAVSRKRNNQLKTESPEVTKKPGAKDNEDSSDSQVSGTDLHLLNKSLSIKVHQLEDDFEYFNSPIRTPDVLPEFTTKKLKPKADPYTTEKHREIINSTVSTFEFTLIIIDLLKELCKAESSLSGSEGSQISVQCINYSLRNLCSLQFSSSSPTAKSYSAGELSKIKLALTELLIVSLDKVLVRADLCSKLITNGILPMLLRILEDIINKFKTQRHDEKIDIEDKVQSIELVQYVFGIAYSVVAFFHCLLMQCRSIEKLHEFTEQFKLYGECSKGNSLRECIELIVRVPGAEGEAATLALRLVAVVGGLVLRMKVRRSEVVHAAACARGRHKACRARVAAGVHHHHAALGAARPAPAAARPCSVAALLANLAALLHDDQVLAHYALRVKVLRCFLTSGVCCCFPATVLMENLVRVMVTHPSSANLCLRVLEHTVYGELGASVLVPRGGEDRLPCQVCQPNDVVRDPSRPFADRKNFCSFLIHYNSLLQLDNSSGVLHATVAHLHRVTPKCRTEIKYEILFSVIYPTFIVAKHRYTIRSEESAFFLTASCLDVFASLLNTVTFAEQFIQKGGLSYVLELVSMTEFSKQCCAILEIAIIVEIHKACRECPDLSFYSELSALPSVAALLECARAATERCYVVLRARLPAPAYEAAMDVRGVLATLQLPPPGDERARPPSAPIDIRKDDRQHAEDTEDDFAEVLNVCARVWSACAGACCHSPGWRRAAARSLLPPATRLLRLLLAAPAPALTAPPALHMPLLEALLTVHATLADVTNGTSKTISCEIIQSALENSPLARSVRHLYTEEEHDPLDENSQQTEKQVQSKDNVQKEVENVQKEEQNVQNAEHNVQKAELNVPSAEHNVQNEECTDQMKNKDSNKATNDLKIGDIDCNVLRQFCECLIRVSMKNASDVEVLPPRCPVKGGAAAVEVGADTGAESGSDRSGASRSESESAAGPYASERSESPARGRDGYEADVEMGKLAQVSISRSRKPSASNTPVHYPELQTDMWCASERELAHAACESERLAHPEYCELVLAVLGMAVRRAMSVKAEYSMWSGVAMRVCGRFPPAPLAGALLQAVRPLLLTDDAAYIELQRSVLSAFEASARVQLESSELRSFLRLLQGARAPAALLLGALRRLAVHAPAHEPERTLRFPIALDAPYIGPIDNLPVNPNSQAEIMVKRYRDQHLHSGAVSCWARHCAHGALGGGGGGWSPWLQGAALLLAVRPATTPAPATPTTATPTAAAHTHEDSEDECVHREAAAAGSDGARKRLGSKRETELAPREFSHVLSLGHESLMFEIWWHASSGTLSFRLTRPDALKPLSSATVWAGAGAGGARSLAAQLTEIHNKRKLYIQATIYIDGCQVETISLPLPGILVRKASASVVLIGDIVSTNQSAFVDQWELASASIYRGLALTPAAVLRRVAIGPFAPPQLHSVVDKPIPNYETVLSPDLLESNIDWEQVFESEAAAAQMDEKLAWYYTAHDPYRALIYSASAPTAGGSGRGAAPPETAAMVWRAPPALRAARRLPHALLALGGPRVLAALMLRVCDMTGGRGDEEQGLALSALLTASHKDPRLYTQLYSHPLPDYPPSLYTLQACLSAACSGAPVLALAGAGGGAVLRLQSAAVLLRPELLQPKQEWLHCEVRWVEEGGGGGGGGARALVGSLWALYARALGVLLRAQHPHRHVVARRLHADNAVDHLLMPIKERLLVWEGGAVQAAESAALAAAARALLVAPSPPRRRHLLDLLLLLHEAGDTYTSGENFYFLLTPEQPESEEFSLLTFMGKKNTRRKKKHIPVNCTPRTSTYTTSMTSSVTSDDTSQDGRRSAGSARADLSDSLKHMKGIINMHIKEGRKHIVSTTSVSENSDANFDESSSTGESMRECGAEGVAEGGVEGGAEGGGWGSEGEAALGDYIVVGDDEVRAAASATATTASVGDLNEHLYHESELRSGATAGWTVIEDFTELLYDIVVLTAQEHPLSEQEVEQLLALGAHPSPRARAHVLRALAAAQRRAPPAPAPHPAPLAQGQRAMHLAHQISQHECSAELAEACVSLITQCDVPLEDQLNEVVWADVTSSDLALSPPLLAVLPRTLHVPGLTEQLLEIVCRIIDKASLKQLSELFVCEALCRCLCAPPAPAPAPLAALSTALTRLALKAVTLPHSLQTVYEVHHMLGFAGRAGGAAGRGARRVLAALFAHELHALHALAQPTTTQYTYNYFATVVSNAMLGGPECLSRGEASTRHRAVLARALYFLLPIDAPTDDEIELFERVLDALLDASESTRGGGEAGMLAGEALSWALRPPPAPASAARPQPLTLARRTLTLLAARARPPALPNHPHVIEKMCVYTMWCIAALHGGGGGSGGGAPLGVTDWAREWALSLPAPRPAAAAAAARAAPLARQDARRWADMRDQPPHKCIFRGASAGASLSVAVTAAAAEAARAAGAARLALLTAERARRAARAAAHHHLTDLADTLSHEHCVWHSTAHYPVSWGAGRGAGAARGRLRRTHLRIPRRFLQAQHQYKADIALRGPALQCRCGQHVAARAGAGGWAGAGAGRPLLAARALCVLLHDSANGDLILTDKGVHFIPDEPQEVTAPPPPEVVDDSTLTRKRRGPIVFDPIPPMTWWYEDLSAVVSRRWCLEERGVELDAARGDNALLALASRAERDALLAALPAHLRRNDEEYVAECLSLWRAGTLSNWEYLRRVNCLGGRSYCDLMQYPVLPFVLAEYDARVLDLTQAASFRDLAKPIAVQSAARERHYINTYNDLLAAGGAPGPHHYASLYSNSGAVLHYLLRLPPYTQLFLNYQDNNFDIPDRTFHSLATTWRLVTMDSPTDVKELVPEFFYLPEMFCNNEGLELGVRQCGSRVEHVSLPRWACDARALVLLQRAALEAPAVTARLPAWLDLVFGCKQTGAAARQALNVYPACTYYGFRPQELEDEVSVSAAEAMVRTYGQVPRRLFAQRHPLADAHLYTQEEEEPAVSVYAGVRGARWGRYVGSPGAPPPALAARRRAARLVCPPAPPLAAPVAVPAHSLLLPPPPPHTIKHASGKDKAGVGWSLLSWAGGDGVRLHTRQDTQLLVHTVHQDEQILCGCSWERGAALGQAGGRVLVLTRGGAGSGGAWRARQLLAHAAPVAALHACAVMRVLVSASEDGLVVLWDLDELSYVRTIPNNEMLPVTHVTVSETLGDVATVHSLTAPRPVTKPSYSVPHRARNQTGGGVGGGGGGGDSAQYEAARAHFASLLRVHSVNARYVGSVKVAEPVAALCYSHAEEGRSVNCIAAALSSGGVRLYSSWDLRPVAHVPPAAPHPLTSICYSRDLEALWATDASGAALCWESAPSSRGPVLLAHTQLL